MEISRFFNLLVPENPIIWGIQFTRVSLWVVALITLMLFAVFVWGQCVPAFRRVAPAIMTSLGIFGTFVGILLALLGLKFGSSAEIDASIPKLLQGMQTAFITSCMGLGFAIGARLFWWKSDGKHEPLTAGETEIIGALNQISAEIADLRKINREGFAKLDGLAEAIRDALVKNIQNLINEIRKAIVDELAKSMDDLIDKIDQIFQDKLGDAFQQLKESVEKLNLWQQEYIGVIETATSALQKAESGLTTASKSIQKIEEHCASIPQTMNELKTAITDVDEKIAELDERLKTFKSMKDDAEKTLSALRDIPGKIDKIVAGFSGLKVVLENAKKEADSLLGAITQQVDGIGSAMRSQTKKEIGKIGDDMRTEINVLHGKINAQIETMSKTWGDNLLAIAEECAKVIKNANRKE